MAKLDYSKIFIKDACPTAIGGQAVMEGVMMQGPDRIALAMRLPSGELYLKTKRKKSASPAMKIPFVRGIVAFVNSLVLGMSTLMESADILEAYAPEQYAEEESKFEKWMTDKFGKKAAWNFLMTLSVILAFVITIVFFVILPTWAVNLLKKVTENAIVLNLVEGVLRIILFILYIVAIRRLEDIKTLFRYHGAEHKSIHCFENGLPLTPENADQFYTLHPRCGTSFLVFVLIISLLLFSFLGWPNLLYRILSRILLLPVIAGISYELLKWAGRSDNAVVRVLSYPGLMLQKLTTAEPTLAQLEVGLLALKAVLVERGTPMIEGFVDADGNLVNQFDERDFLGTIAPKGKNAHIEEEATVQAKMKHTAVRPVPVEEAIKESFTYEGVTITNKIAVEWGQKKLENVTNGRNEALTIFTYVTGLTRSSLITRADEPIREGSFTEYKRKINERLSGRPLQYIVGTQQFMGLHFRVNTDVLIPRMDTEVLVDKVINIVGNKIKNGEWKELRFLDMCTGSGCIGITLASRFKNAIVTMADASEAALTTAVGNAQLNEVFPRCVFLIGNMFNALPSGSKFQLITCNPPYIKSDVIPTLDKEVRDYEPRMALDGGADGLDYYRVIAEKAGEYLEPGGILALEIGCDQAADVTGLLNASGRFAASVVFDDLAGLNRVIIAERKLY